MAAFIESCCCNGKQPNGTVSKRRVARPEAVGLLLRDRSVARFLVAPDGYGKTHVAFEYAAIMFSFRHVVWVRGASPCFVRDLDRGTLAEEIKEADGAAALVVFDGIPMLDPVRTELFSAAIDALLEAQCEVIVVCTPSADTFSSLQKDRVVIGSSDLLLDESEVAALGLAGVSHANIACMAWGEEGPRTLLEGCSREEMPSDLRFALACLLMMGAGPVSSALPFFDEAQREEVVEFLARFYTFLGIDGETGCFHAMDVPVSLVKEELLASFDEVVGCTCCSCADELASSLANGLLTLGRPQRACEVLVRYATSVHFHQWCLQRAWQLIFRGYPLCVVALMGQGDGADATSPKALLALAWACWGAGMRKEAAAYGRKACKAKGALAQTQASALCLLAHLSPTELDGEETLLFAESLGALEREGSETGRDGWEPDWLALGRALLPVSLGEAMEEQAWRLMEQELERNAGKEEAGALCASMLLGAAWTIRAQKTKEGASEEEPSNWNQEGMREKLVEFAGRLESRLPLSFDPEIMAVPLLEVKYACSDHPTFQKRFDAALPQEVAAMLPEVRMRLERQVQEVARKREGRLEQRAHFNDTHPDPFRRTQSHPVLSQSSVPQLEIRMFGGLEILIDGEAVDPKKLTRRRMRTLAAALALNKGHELARERLCRIIWPETDPESCVSSFYSVWASLKRALTFEGTCPYLVRSQIGCSLDGRYLVTDMEEFERICTALVFGGGQMGSWEDMYAKVTVSFADDLLPNEECNPYIDGIRQQCRNRLVDGLLSASKRLLAAEEQTGALWFSREALRRDEGREDVYITLMEAQIAANQRGPALETYFTCRKFLSDDLGIDPSPRLVELYRSIIEYEEAI